MRATKILVECWRCKETMSEQTGCCPSCGVLLDHEPCSACHAVGYHAPTCATDQAGVTS